MFETMEKSGEKVPEVVRGLAEGLDFVAKGFALKLLKRSPVRDEILHLWWD